MHPHVVLSTLTSSQPFFLIYAERHASTKLEHRGQKTGKGLECFTGHPLKAQLFTSKGWGEVYHVVKHTIVPGVSQYGPETIRKSAAGMLENNCFLF